MRLRSQIKGIANEPKVSAQGRDFCEGSEKEISHL